MEKEIFTLLFHPKKTEILFFGGSENILYILNTKDTNIFEADVFDDSVLHINTCSDSILVVSSFKEIRIYECENDLSLLSSFVFDADIEWTQTVQKRIVSGHKDSTISVIDLETAETVFFYGTGSMHAGYVFQDENNILSILSANTEGMFFYFNEIALTAHLKYKDYKSRDFICLKKQENTSLVALGFGDGSVSLFHIEKRILINELEKHSGPVECVFFKKIAQKELCVSCCLSGEIKFFCLNIKLPTITIKLESGVSVYSLEDKEYYFYVGCVDGSVYQINCINFSAIKIRECDNSPILCIQKKQKSVWIGAKTIEKIEIEK